tara:strand:- start:206 stop:949 length:744 start_codon:yes stop_codon:yes gene_type:complete
MNNRLQDKIIIVTGGNGLLGKAMVSRIKAEGGFCINMDINHETNEDLSLLHCDITNQDSIKQAVRLVVDTYNRIDGLVNNAYPRTKDWGNKFEDIVFDSWKDNVDMQMNSSFYMCQQVLEQMKTQKSGSVINITSIYGVVGNDFTVYEGTGGTSPAAYSAIKGGLINFTRYLASYFGKFNVRTNCVSPGGIFDNQHETFVKNYEKKVPMQRMGTPDDIAPSVAFLLSDDSKYITGQNIIVDGGWTAI